MNEYSVIISELILENTVFLINFSRIGQNFTKIKADLGNSVLINSRVAQNFTKIKAVLGNNVFLINLSRIVQNFIKTKLILTPIYSLIPLRTCVRTNIRTFAQIRCLVQNYVPAICICCIPSN